MNSHLQILISDLLTRIMMIFFRYVAHSKIIRTFWLHIKNPHPTFEWERQTARQAAEK